MPLHARRSLLLLACLLCLPPAAPGEEGSGDGPALLIRDATLWNGTADHATAGQSLLIEGGMIRAVGEALEAPPGARVIDAGGRFVMPGIIDAHTHLALPVAPDRIHEEDPSYLTALSLEAARLVLMRGWTTVRDIGGPAQGLARAIDEGLAIGPRIYPSAAVVSQTSGHGDRRALTDLHPASGAVLNPYWQRYSLLADGPAEVRRAVRESLRQGAAQIKLMAGGGISSDYDPIDTVQFSEAELRAAVEAAADWGTYVAVHAYTDAAVRRALAAGVKVIEHGHLVSEDTLRELKRRGAFLSSQSFGFVREYARRGDSRRARKAELVMSGTDNLMNTAKRLGIPVAFGTDSFGSLRAYRGAVKEFGYRLRWFTPLEILKQATSVNARLLALTGPRNPYPDGPLGVIEPGAYADILIVDGDPLADIRILERPAETLRLVVKGGRIYRDTLTQ
ncbi:MAG: amidohydrolase family protein [Gammaproteobacteria bacterium]|nr:MAG: amidohydrolase family protein [Gammaproteobacteria bacterium]